MAPSPEPQRKLLLAIRRALMLVLGELENYLGLDRTYRPRLKRRKERIRDREGSRG